MSFWLVFGGGIAVGFGIATFLFVVLMALSLAKASGGGAVEEEEYQRVQEEGIKKQQQVETRRAQIHVVA